MPSNELQIIGPKRAGILDQFLTFGWKFYSTRFGPRGCAFQADRPLRVTSPHSTMEKAVHADGSKFHRRLEGKNGWLWNTIFKKISEIHNLKRDIAENHLRIPPATLWRRIGLYLFFGYIYPKPKPREDEYD